MKRHRSSNLSMHMTTLDSSSSAAESSMDDASNHRRHNHHHHQTLKKPKPRPVVGDNEEEEEEEGEVWQSFSTSFHQVQSVLDRNRALIQQVNDNHQSRLPDNMVKNVALIQEINGNISKVVSLYSDLSTNFSSIFHEQQRSKNGKPETPPPPQR